MADLVAADLTYAAQNPVQGELTHGGKMKRILKITTAAGSYPTGGLPLTNSKLGCPTVLESLVILEPSAADAYAYEWDKSANKLKVYVGAAEHANAAFTSPDELIVEAIGW
jgi:hypothetical protein